MKAFRMVALGMTLAGMAGPALGQDARPSPKEWAGQLVSVSSVLGPDGPQWTPDGSRIVFPSTFGGNAAMWSVGPDGGAPTRVTRDIGAQIPRISPRGEWIAYLSEKGGSPELWLWSVADNRDLPLTNLGARINAFSWSPDGHSIAFSALRYGQFDVWTVAVPSGEIRRLTTDERYELYPTWTPDSRNIVYVRSDDRWADHDVMVMTASGDHQRVLTHDADMFDYGTIGTRSRFGYVQVSPDGKTALFRSHRSGW